MSRVKRFTFHPQGAEHIELFRAGRIKGTIHLIYWRPFDLQRHRQAPLLREREEFLLDLLKQGSGRIPVQNVGTMLLRAIEATNIKTLLPLGDGDISRIAQKIWGNRVLSDSKKPGHNSAHMLRFCLRKFLRFHSKFKVQKSPHQPFVQELDRFSEYNRCRGLLPDAIESHRQKAATFLKWYSLRSNTLARLSVRHVDRFVTAKWGDGWSGATVSSAMQALRIFVRYGHKQGWCPNIAEGIKGPYHSRLGSKPQGRSWTEVVKLLDATKGEDLASVRARAALSLISTYALRSSEVRRILLTDFDWKKEALTMRRSKRGRRQRLPLQREVIQAVLKYIRLRPRCPDRHLFISLRPPFRSIERGAIYGLTSCRLKKIGVTTGHLGPHAIRHARAMQLLRSGTSVKEIGEFLGQSHPESPLFYTNFDVELLREVADFNLGGLI
jgi:integrase/recombinase XerD